MLKLWLLPLLFLNTFALEISMEGAKDDYSTYSILKLTDSNKFLCQSMYDDFENTKEIVCAFSKRPFKKIQTLQNDFFKVETFIQKETFFISVKPFYKIKLIPEIFDLTQDKTVFKVDVSLSSHWVILGYKEKLPLITNRKKPDTTINFPFYSDADLLPYVGSLDIKGNPVKIQKVGDVKKYLELKTLFTKEKYDQCLDTIEEILEEYPNTLFKAELIYYKIKIYSKIKDYDNVISSAKVYLREYSSNPNIPEVLALIAKGYAQIGLNIDADYFFDRLFSEHEESVFAKWGYIYKGEMLELNGGLKAALKFYKKALFSTSNLDVAATAAFDIAKAEFDLSQKESIKYVEKIIKVKPSYFFERYKESKKMMNSFADYEKYKTASDIATALLDAINPSYDDYEILLSQKALWLAKTDDKENALIALNSYIKKFPDGDYLQAVEIAKDGLFFDTTDENVTARLAGYEKLIQEYQDDTIGSRALYEKAKLLLSQKMYDDVLKDKADILELDSDIYPDTEQIIHDAAIGMMEVSLEKKACSDVLYISNEYNITLSDSWDDGVYECAMKGGDYQLGKSICEKNFKSSNIDERKKWLYRYVKVDFVTGNYSDVLDASRDLIALIDGDKKSPYRDIYRYIFDTYERLEQKDKMLEAMKDIEHVFGDDYIDIDRYTAVMSIGSERKDDNIVIKYGTKVEKIQEKSNSYPQSPFVELTLYQAYVNRENYNDAYKIIKKLDRLELTKTQRARQKYLKGSVLSKLWRDDEAKIAYEEAIKADSTSAWANLAKSALEI